MNVCAGTFKQRASNTRFILIKSNIPFRLVLLPPARYVLRSSKRSGNTIPRRISGSVAFTVGGANASPTAAIGLSFCPATAIIIKSFSLTLLNLPGATEHSNFLLPLAWSVAHRGEIVVQKTLGDRSAATSTSVTLSVCFKSLSGLASTTSLAWTTLFIYVYVYV